MKKEKDLPLGMLLIVISQFFLAGIDYTLNTNIKLWYSLPLVVFSSIVYWRLFTVGWAVAFEGIEIDDTEK